MIMVIILVFVVIVFTIMMAVLIDENDEYDENVNSDLNLIDIEEEE